MAAKIDRNKLGSVVDADAPVREHPLYPIFMEAIRQAMYGKGERHGGAVIPFKEQQWAYLGRIHGQGFLTGQASKKLNEAAMSKDGEAYIAELLGALVYTGAAIILSNDAGEE